MDIFFLHFCAHLCTSYFLCDQSYFFAKRSKLSNFSALLVSVAITLIIGLIYKGAEAYLVGHCANFWQAMSYNVVGTLIAVNKIAPTMENGK